MLEDRKSPTVELKEKYSDTFLKSVSAFANFHDGEIVFGVRDNGDLIGIENPDAFSLQIETKINDSIAPRPQFSIEQKKTDGRVIVCVKVRKGPDAPYLYKGQRISGVIRPRFLWIRLVYGLYLFPRLRLNMISSFHRRKNYPSAFWKSNCSAKSA